MIEVSSNSHTVHYERILFPSLKIANVVCILPERKTSGTGYSNSFVVVGSTMLPGKGCRKASGTLNCFGYLVERPTFEVIQRSVYT